MDGASVGNNIEYSNTSGLEQDGRFIANDILHQRTFFINTCMFVENGWGSEPSPYFDILTHINTAGTVMIEYKDTFLVWQKFVKILQIKFQTKWSNKMTTFSNGFSWTSCLFFILFHWYLLVRVPLRICDHWLRYQLFGRAYWIATLWCGKQMCMESESNQLILFEEVQD